MDNATILQALEQLDVDNDNHWTSDGLPRIDAVQALVEGKVTREEITAASQGFSRQNLNLPTTVPNKPIADDGVETPAEEGSDADVAAILATTPLSNRPVASDGLGEDFQNPEADEAELLAFKEATARLEVARKTLSQAQKAFATAQQEVDEFIRKKEADENTAESNVRTMQAYQRSQAELRSRQVAQQNAVAEITQKLAAGALIPDVPVQGEAPESVVAEAAELANQ